MLSSWNDIEITNNMYELEVVMLTDELPSNDNIIRYRFVQTADCIGSSQEVISRSPLKWLYKQWAKHINFIYSHTYRRFRLSRHVLSINVKRNELVFQVTGVFSIADYRWVNSFPVHFKNYSVTLHESYWISVNRTTRAISKWPSKKEIST